MSLALGERVGLYLLVHEVLFLAAAHQLRFHELEVIASKVVELVFHLPYLRFFNFRFSDG